jgi:tRNA (guanine-N7-)-methyltransferase
MAQKKLFRFEAIRFFPNVLQFPEGMAGKWKEFFGNDHGLILELACGRGEYTVGLAKIYPDRNCVGVDLKGNRIYIGAKKCLEEKISNAAFLRTRIDQINDYFGREEVKEIWLTFPDPQLRVSRAKKRLVHPRFLRLYQQFLVPGGKIHLKTDSPVLYEFTLLVIHLYGLTLLEQMEDIHSQSQIRPELEIRTHYEGLDIAESKKVHYICFSLPPGILPEIDPILLQRIKENERAIN